MSMYGYLYKYNTYRFSENDRFFYNSYYDAVHTYLIRLNTDYTIDKYATFSQYIAAITTIYPIIYKNYLLIIYNDNTIDIYNLNLTEDDIVGNKKAIDITYTSDYYRASLGTGLVDEDNNRVILFNSGTGAAQNDVGFNILDLTNIDIITDNTVLENLQTEYLYEVSSNYGNIPKCNSSRNSIICYKKTTDGNIEEIKQLLSTVDEDNIIGVIYKNKHFSYVQPQILSAGQEDVRAGKTFIGWQGYPETGTMEVNEQ